MLLFLGNARQHLAMVLKSISIIRKVHLCQWPAEFWIEASELHAVTREQHNTLAELGGAMRILPSPYGSWRRTFWEWRGNLSLRWHQKPGTEVKLQKYALKIVVLLMSDC